MKKALKIVGKILLIILILLIVFLLILFIYSRITLKKEDELLKNYPGEFVEVDGHNMNIYAEGEGTHTLVFLAPAGDTSPILTFKPLYSGLNSEYKTVVIEKFGYGMSDIVDSERDYETMVNECREALSKANVEAPYILCPYSKSGLDALIWTQEYPDEVEAIVGIDMAFPKSYENVNLNVKDNSKFFDFLRGVGIARLLTGDSVYPETYSQEDKDIARALDCRKFGNKVAFNEMITVPEACDMINGRPKADIPMYLFLTNGATTGMDKQTWQGFAYGYADDMKNVSFTEFDCGHNELVYKESEKICKEMEEFIESLNS